MYDKICEKLLIWYISFMTLIGYSITPKNEADSFIVTQDGIEILETTKETDKTNLGKYLRHHIMYTDDKFHSMYFFDGPLIVRFKYQNEIYRIYLKQLESKNTDHSVIMKEPKFLSAMIKSVNEIGKTDDIYITEKIVELHGPERNFFSHIPDAVGDFSVLLKEHKGELHTFDMMGNQKVHEL